MIVPRSIPCPNSFWRLSSLSRGRKSIRSDLFIRCSSVLSRENINKLWTGQAIYYFYSIATVRTNEPSGVRSEWIVEYNIRTDSAAAHIWSSPVRSVFNLILSIHPSVRTGQWLVFITHHPHTWCDIAYHACCLQRTYPRSDPCLLSCRMGTHL